MRKRASRAGLAFLAGALCLLPAGLVTAAAPSTALTFYNSRASHGGFEPRIAAGPDGRLWVGTQAVSGPEQVFQSGDAGLTWSKTQLDPPGGSSACCDNDIVVTRTGRVIAATITGNLGFDIEYSDDGGASWTESRGINLADQDREWLAAGPVDPTTGQPIVYLLWHNLVSGAADHEMLVSTSRDNGATFLPPVPVTTPGNQAWLDLQCADSGGPSNIFVNATTGQVYAVWGTRSSVVGGCGASVLGPFEINVVAATRVWVATSADEGLTWTDSLAVDDSQTGNIVGMQLQAGAVDNQGNVYVVYPESPRAYSDYDGAAVRYVHSDGGLGAWSQPVTVAAGGGPGHVLPYMEAGEPGRLAFFYLTGHPAGAGSPVWEPEAAVTLDGLDASPVFDSATIDALPTWQGTASQLMGYCMPYGQSQQPPYDILNAVGQGFGCSRSSDVLGMTLDQSCRYSIVWDASGLAGLDAGTFVSTPASGPALGSSCPVAGMPVAALPAGAPRAVAGVQRAGGSRSTLPDTAAPTPASGVLLVLALLFLPLAPLALAASARFANRG